MARVNAFLWSSRRQGRLSLRNGAVARLVKGNMSIRPGTAIATFDRDGHYGNHTDGRSHAAIYLGQDAERIHVIEQWNVWDHGQLVKHIAPHERIISFNNPKVQSINQGENYYVVE